MTAPAPIRVLILEDNPSDTDLMVDALVQAGLDLQWERVDTEPDFTARLTSELDLILSDYTLPQFTGLEALQLVRSRGLDVPFILVSGSIGEEIAVEAMRSGADDYLLKDRIARLGQAALQALERRRLRMESEQAAEELRRSESLKGAILESSLDCLITIDHEGKVVEFNPAAEATFGLTREHALGKAMVELIVPLRLRDAHRRGFAHYLATGEGPILGKRLELEAIRADGTEFPIELAITAIGATSTPMFTGFIRDITARKEAEGKIKRLNRVYAVLSGINSLIVRVHERRELFKEACRITVEHGNFGMAWIGTFDPATQDVTPVAWAGERAEELSSAKSSAREDSPRGKGAVGQSIRERRPVFNNDLTAHSVGRPRLVEMLRLGFRSQITLPLFEDQTVVGTLTMYAREPDFFDEEEVRLLTELAGDISFALEHIARQEKLAKLSRIRAVLGEINAAIVRIRSKQEVFDEACRIAVNAGHFPFAWIGIVDREAKQLVPVAWAGEEGRYLDTMQRRRSLDGTISAQGGPAIRAVREKKALIVNDIQAAPLILSKQEHLEHNVNSLAMLPLVVADEAVGVLALYAREVGFFDEEEMKLLFELAGDITFALQTIEKQEQLDYLSYYDPLTGLPNRTLFIDRAGQQIHARSSEPLLVGLILLNLERFRNINETFGRHGGDELLRQVALRLESAFHGKDYLARIGADGFGVLLRGIRDASAVAHALENQLLGCFREPYKLDDSELRVAARAGIALFPADGGDADTLFKNAEAALKRAKDSSEHYLFYAAEMNARAAQALSLETRLRKAVEAQQFVMHYQPKIELASGAICGLEALIRWQEPGVGLVPPGNFIPLLEETGLILEVGKWALARALSDHREWTGRGCPVPRIAVNVSAIQLQRGDFADTVIHTVREEGDNPDALELEITESLLMKDVQASIQKLSILRDLGIHIAMDDFGTGYSSLSYIARLPITSLKIDRSFINGMARSEQDMVIVTTIIALAHSLNLKVIAEGVETKEQAQTLKFLRCDEVQGFLYSRPVPAAEIEQMLRAPATVTAKLFPKREPR
jgi:PAS domain S-box-containing protein/diguanylate cyclase (GGDEF)-like protein